MALVIVGDSPGRGDFVAGLKAAAAPISRRVHFLGFRYGEDLHRLFANAGAFVLPSETEGLSLTLLEAMAHEAPVIASDIPQNRAVVAAGGFAFATRDALALGNLLGDFFAGTIATAEVQTRVRTARVRVLETFSWDAVTDSYEALYAAARAGAGVIGGRSTGDPGADAPAGR